MTEHICICRYPLLIIDNREGKGIEYLAMPIEVIKDGDMPVPEIDYEETEGFDGIIKSYISVKWQNTKDGDILKKYDVAGHIAIAGCTLQETSIVDGTIACTDKSIFKVLHPAEEWVKEHVIELKPTQEAA